MLLGKISKFCLGVLSLAVLSAAPLAAETQPGAEHADGCVALIRECLNSSMERSSCLYSAATNPFCGESELGRLTYKRWSMSHQDLEDATPSLLGPQLVDQECMTRFDASWAKELAMPSIDADTVRTLFSSLDLCRRDGEIQMDLGRP